MIDIEENTAQLLKMLEACNVSNKEFEHRKIVLEKEQSQPGSIISRICDQYYNRAHEIKAFYFLRQLGKVSISEDCSHHAGCDCNLNNHYQIECVCSSAGENGEKAGLCNKQKLKFYVGKYNKSFLLTRFTSSLSEKLRFYNNHKENGTVDSSLPYVVFLGLGALANEFFAGENGIEFTSMLFGKGDPTLSIDADIGCMTPNGYSHNKVIYNHNNKEINCNIFASEDYRCVSGIIISAAKLYEEYTIENTWLFINPEASIKVNPRDFANMVYWDLYNEYEYGPYLCGEKIEKS